MPHERKQSFLEMELNNRGDYLAGIFAPLAFLWLVIGYLQNNRSIRIQSNELRNSVEALNLQSRELRNSVEEQKKANKTSAVQLQSIVANERHARRDLFFRFFDIKTKELNTHALEIAHMLAKNSYNYCVGYKNNRGIYESGHGNILLMISDITREVNDMSVNHNSKQYKNFVTLTKDPEHCYITETMNNYLKDYQILLEAVLECDEDDPNPRSDLKDVVIDSPYAHLKNALENLMSSIE